MQIVADSNRKGLYQKREPVGVYIGMIYWQPQSLISLAHLADDSLELIQLVSLLCHCKRHTPPDVIIEL